MSTGTASALFLAHRAREMADEQTSAKIARAIVSVENAFLGKDPQLALQTHRLKQAAQRVLGVQRSNHSGPLEGQLTVGND